MRANAVCAYTGADPLCRAARMCTITPPRHWACSFKRRICQNVPPIGGLYAPQVHENCVCNELVSLGGRHLQEVPEPTKLGLRMLRAASKWYLKFMQPVEPIGSEEFLSHYSGPKRTRYENAWKSLQEVPLGPRDAYVDAFIKAEKFDPGVKCNPDPRLIQARSPRYNMSFGMFLRPIFKQFSKLVDGIGSRIIVKGMNMADRAMLFMHKWSQFNHPVAFELDGSRFDAHLHAKVLSIADGAFSQMARSAVFDALLRMRRVTKGKTMNGVRYRIRGRRCSGDFDTGDGNSYIMACMIRAAMKHLMIKRWSAEVDGDNAVLIVEARDRDRLVREAPGAFLHVGQEIKIENEAREPWQVKMCQATMYETEPGEWTLLRDWRKVLSGETSGFKHWDQPSVLRSMFTTVGQCDLALHSGVPVLQGHALALLRNGDGRFRADLLNLDDMIHRFGQELGREPLVAARKCSARNVTPFARSSFERSFGVSPERQLWIEGSLAEWKLTSVNPIDSGLQWDWRWVDLTPPDLVLLD